MSISEQRFTEGTVISVNGHLESGAAPGAQMLLETITNVAAPIFVFDCEGLKYVSSAGLRVFLYIAKKVKTQHKAKVALAGLDPMVHEIFEISGFSAVFTIYPTVGNLALGNPIA